jgi:dienelactone hydrolase
VKKEESRLESTTNRSDFQTETAFVPNLDPPCEPAFSERVHQSEAPSPREFLQKTPHFILKRPLTISKLFHMNPNPFPAPIAASKKTALLLISFMPALLSISQPYGNPDRSHPGDIMIQEYLRQATEQIETPGFQEEAKSAVAWEDQQRPQYLEQFYHMLGLSPLPERTPLHATITSTLDQGDYLVDMLHYQSMPGLHVTANLYRPAQVREGEKLPAIFYVCGHSHRGRHGNKTAFQDHGIWFARNGYVCLVVDTLQLGEIAGIHHGTYREELWWWLARGYTPAGIEAWNGIRGIDYLISRPDVDPDRIGVTGISGGGATTFWIAAADERVKASAPVSGMADLLSYIPNRVINGHCDCMFLYNTYQWPWTRIAYLIAPRPMLFVNSDEDPIFPMDANERISNRLERFYSLFGAGDQVDAFISMGGHDYRKDIRQAVFRFMNIHLKNDPSPVLDSELALVHGARPDQHPIPPEKLRVFPRDSDLPQDALNGRIDESFVPMAKLRPPAERNFQHWQEAVLQQLREVSFQHFPERIAAAEPARQPPIQVERDNTSSDASHTWLATEPGIAVRLAPAQTPSGPERIFLVVTGPDGIQGIPPWLQDHAGERDAIYLLEPRGFGRTQWTRRNPPNYVERSHYLLGRTVDGGRVWDIAATARFLAEKHGSDVVVAGENASAVLGLYAALLEPEIASLLLRNPPLSHMENDAPILLNVLRVLDIPQALGLLAPRELTVSSTAGEWRDEVSAFYESAGAKGKVLFHEF